MNLPKADCGSRQAYSGKRLDRNGASERPGAIGAVHRVMRAFQSSEQDRGFRPERLENEADFMPPRVV
jgi:hypothetical protein